MRRFFIWSLCLIAIGAGCTDKKAMLQRWSHTPEEIRLECKQASESLMILLNLISQSDTHNFQNVVWPIEIALAEFANKVNPLTFYGSVSPIAEVRQAAVECEKQTSKLKLEVFTRNDLYRVVKKTELENNNLSEADKKLLQEYLRSFHENGLDLEPSQKSRLEGLRKELITLESDYEETLTNATTHIHLSKSELAGVPASLLARLKPSGEAGKDYILTFQYPDYYPAMEYIKDGNVRKVLSEKFNQRGGEANRSRLQKAIAIRYEIAKTLGYETYAHLKLENTMAKTPQAVEAFLQKLYERLHSQSAADSQEMLTLKRIELGDPLISNLELWDFRYYERMLKETKYQLDQQVIKTYFPLNRVIDGMFKIYEKLLGVQFQGVQEVPLWHDTVRYYEIIDPKSQKEIAAFYMDLFPREGKYGHASAFAITTGYRQQLGPYVKPVSAIVANFNPPQDGRPSLLTHQQVETLFHEFGHVMHQTLSKSLYATLAGNEVKRDFVEAPSQMLENWVWRWEPLTLISSHYESGAQLPQELLQKMLAVKKLNQGIDHLRQLFYARIDLAYHSLRSSDPIDTTTLYHDLYETVMQLPASRATMPEASFEHLMSGYDASYYGYLWSEVFAADMFTRFEASGLFNGETGALYRQLILEPGASKDPAQLLSSFLGRQPSEEAFLKKFN